MFRIWSVNRKVQKIWNCKVEKNSSWRMLSTYINRSRTFWSSQRSYQKGLLWWPQKTRWPLIKMASSYIWTQERGKREHNDILEGKNVYPWRLVTPIGKHKSAIIRRGSTWKIWQGKQAQEGRPTTNIGYKCSTPILKPRRKNVAYELWVYGILVDRDSTLVATKDKMTINKNGVIIHMNTRKGKTGAQWYNWRQKCLSLKVSHTNRKT